MDYGHPLEFGAFITPVADPPDAPVRLARFAEDAGLDLVTFQDHPYQPRFHDTLTLLTWVAAQTSRIRVSGNVLNLPLRQPAVLGRTAASLDLLSGGRFELAIGSSGFWDAIAAMGGPRRSPGESVEALQEAIAIIRGIWDGDERSALRLHGRHYSVDGAKRGPAPAHDIPIWIGAYQPRMLRLTGRLGDGWLPSLPYLKPGDLQRGNATIDDAAAGAGRDPREIRRLLNINGRFASSRSGFLQGPVDAWVEDLVQLALEDGVGTFILVSDDPGDIARFAEEVAPAVRDAVAAERASHGTPGGRVRSAAARAQRVAGIDYDGLPASLADTAIEPGDAKYARVRNTYLRGGAPGLVLQVRDAGQVAEALAFARSQPVPLAVRSAGHGISGRSTNDGGIVIDLSRLNRIEVLDEGSRRVRIEPGARWMDVATALAPHGLAITSGDYGGVGVGGLATAGGVGYFAREQGLTIDHVRRMHVVLADGTELEVSDVEHPDLFWAMRGAGANFGVVTSFEFEAHEGGDVGWAQLVFDASDPAGFLERWGRAIEAAPRSVTGQVILGSRIPGQPMLAQALIVVHESDPDAIVAALQPIADIAPMLQQSVQLAPYAAVMANVRGGYHEGRGEPLSRSGLIEHLTPEFSRAAADVLDGGLSHFFSIRAVGGAVADVPEDAMAYSGRSANFALAAMGSQREFADAWRESLVPHSSGVYISFDTEDSDDVVERAFPPGKLARLRELKWRYDPENVFRDNFNVLPRVPDQEPAAL